MIVIGADTHKRAHTLAGVDASTGRVVGCLEISATDEGHRAALAWALGLGEQRIWALEDCRHVSRRLEQALLAAGERVIRVAPGRMGASRKGERQPGKSDRIDALAIARVVVADGPERFPAAYLDERALEVRLLSDHRESLVSERTRAQNQLRWALVALDPELEATLAAGALSHPAHQQRVSRALRRQQANTRGQIARELLARITLLTRRINELERQLRALISARWPQLLSQPGCGTLSAALIIGHTAGAQRFATDAQFARLAGSAPIPASSGNTTRHRLHRGGDRQLNRALHTIAITRARTDPATKAYLTRRQAEGKTRREATRCLKRYLARQVWKLLTQPTTAPTVLHCQTPTHALNLT